MGYLMQVRRDGETAPKDDCVHRWYETASTAASYVVVAKDQAGGRVELVGAAERVMKHSELLVTFVQRPPPGLRRFERAKRRDGGEVELRVVIQNLDHRRGVFISVAHADDMSDLPVTLPT